jgi:hypothetical protein
MIERNKSEIVDNKCYKHIINYYDLKYICTYCEYNKWQSGKPEVKQMSKLDEARLYDLKLQEVGNIKVYLVYEVDKKIELLEKYITELQEENKELKKVAENYSKKYHVWRNQVGQLQFEIDTLKKIK